MLTVERQAELLEILKREKSATVAALTKRLYASEATVRRDLAALEAQGYLKRVHGGAVIGGAPDREIPYEVRESEQERAKEIMARRAAANSANASESRRANPFFRIELLFASSSL